MQVLNHDLSEKKTESFPRPLHRTSINPEAHYFKPERIVINLGVEKYGKLSKSGVWIYEPISAMWQMMNCGRRRFAGTCFSDPVRGIDVFSLYSRYKTY